MRGLLTLILIILFTQLSIHGQQLDSIYAYLELGENEEAEKLIHEYERRPTLPDSSRAILQHYKSVWHASITQDYDSAVTIQLGVDSLLRNASNLAKSRLWADLATAGYRSRQYAISQRFVDSLDQITAPQGMHTIRGLLTKGSLQLNGGDMNGALATFQQAQAAYEALGKRNDNYKSRIVGSIGFLYERMFLPEKAIPYQWESYRLQDPESYLAMRVMCMLAKSYSEIAQYDSAIYCANEALRIVSKTSPPGDIQFVRPLRSKAAVYSRSGKHTQSIKILQEVVALIEKNGPSKKTDLSRAYYDLGLYYLYDGNNNMAHESFRKASEEIGAPRPGGPFLTNLRYEIYDAIALFRMSQKGYPEALDFAENKLNAINHMVDSLKDRNPGGKSDIPLFQLAKIAYSTHMDIKALRCKRTGEQRFLEDAFLLGEKGKSVRLKERIWFNQVQSFAGLPLRLQQKSRRLDSLFEQIKITHFRYPDSLSITIEKNRLEQERTDFLRKLKKEHPAFFQLRYKSPEPSLNAIQRQLADSTWLLSYFHKDSITHAFAVSHDKVLHWRIIVDDSVESLIESWKDCIIYQHKAEKDNFSQKAAQDYQVLTNKLFSLLLKPVWKFKPKRLYIAPDNYLDELPFEALTIPEDTQETDFRKLNYLLRHTDISYLPAANVLLFPAKESRSNEYLGFAPAYKATETQAQGRSFINPLKYNSQEVQSGIEELGGKGLIGKKANKEYFKKNAPKAGILHLALHAMAQKQDPMRSALYFAAEEQEQSALYAYEMYGISLDAKLAILSACQSGSGPLTQTEGLLSLGQAFQYAGCPNILVTQWDIDDFASYSTMRNFFPLLKKHSTPSALRLARMQYLEQSDFVHPYYWAGWKLIGKKEYIQAKKNYHEAMLGTLFILLATFFFLYKSREPVD